MSNLVPSMSDDEDEAIEKAETFLGGLRSELDEGSHLHPSFASLAAAADAIRAGYLSFGITPQRAAEAFQMLRILDDNDIEWTVGPSSGSWFRRRQGSSNWQAGPAPLMAEPKSGHSQPWLSAELSEILPSARNSNKTGSETKVGSQAGIRVVDVSPLSPELERESADWLLSEWDTLEAEMENLQAGARPSVSIADSAAWPVKQMFEKVSKSDSVRAERSEDLGLPNQETTKEPDSDMFDLFVKPEAPAERDGSVLLTDLLDKGPAERENAIPLKAENSAEHIRSEIPVPDSSTNHSSTTGSESQDIESGAPDVPNMPGSSSFQEISDQPSDGQSKNAEPTNGDNPYGI